MVQHEIVVDSWDIGKNLEVIGNYAMKTGTDTIIITFHDRYLGTVKGLVSMVTKAFGWHEVKSGTLETENVRCTYKDDQRMCAFKESPYYQKKCVEKVRKICPCYKQKSKTPIKMNFVRIERFV